VAYSSRIFDSVDHVDLSEWQRIRSACDGSIVGDPRFIAAVEAGIRQVDRLWCIVLYDETGAAVACTTAAAVTTDLADLADPRLARIIRLAPPPLSRLRHLRLLVCGLPIGTGLHTLAFAPRSESSRILPELDRIVCELASTIKADGIVYKEFGSDDLPWTRPLLELGYHQFATPPSYTFRSAFEDFAQYCAALKHHYRKQIVHSRRKLSEAALETVVLSSPEEVVRVYTSEVHALYHQMADRAVIKVEILPIEFLHELTSRMGGQIELLAIRRGAEIFAFGWCLHAGSTYYAMCAGLDDDLNERFDLYFNLLYALLDRGLQKRASIIVFGIGSDIVKRRIGCDSEPLYFFAKGRGPLMSFVVRSAGRLLFAPKPAAAPFNIYRDRGGDRPRAAETMTSGL
jgi:hypothetical protein